MILTSKTWSHPATLSALLQLLAEGALPRGELLERGTHLRAPALLAGRALHLGDPVEQVARLLGITPDEVRAGLGGAPAGEPVPGEPIPAVTHHDHRDQHDDESLTAER